MENQEEQIYKFFINNEKLESLRARLNEFNPFKILRIEDHEIRHSNVLAWLFNPIENHNLDDKILKKFLLTVASSSDNENVLADEIHLIDIEKSNFRDAEVYREQDNIDILVISVKQKLIIAIENKIYSEEHSNQLNRYLEILDSKYPDFKIFPIFLTLYGDKPSNLKYCSASYNDLLKIIEFNINLYVDRISIESFNFIQFYLKILKEKIIVDEKLKELCRSIYSDNKDAIDLIYSIGNEIDIGQSVIDFQNKQINIMKLWSTNKSFWFILPEFRISKQKNTNWADNNAIAYWFSEYYKKIKIVLEIGPFNDSNRRIKFLEMLESKNINVSSRAKEPGRLYTRIYTDTEDVKDWSDRQEITDNMLKLFEKQKLRDIEKKLLSSIDEFDWNTEYI